MAALARYYRSLGLPVAGYDRTPSPLTAQLVREGVAVSYDDSMDAVPAEFRDAEGTLVVYTPAVPDSNVPLGFFRDGGFEVRKRSWVLGQITRGSRGLCFAGTHGKTTTSSMAAHVLHSGTTGCNAFLGGILRGYNSNLILSPTSSTRTSASTAACARTTAASTPSPNRKGGRNTRWNPKWLI